MKSIMLCIAIHGITSTLFTKISMLKISIMISHRFKIVRLMDDPKDM